MTAKLKHSIGYILNTVQPISMRINFHNRPVKRELGHEHSISPRAEDEKKLTFCELVAIREVAHDKTFKNLIHTSKRHASQLCRAKGCCNLSVSRGHCIKHGGGTRCIVTNCSNRAKLNKRCFQHGGYRMCKVVNCTRKAKRHGYCWSHGGGVQCQVDNCSKISTLGGLCWAHGGGNRCREKDCNRRSYQKLGYYCTIHAGTTVIRDKSHCDNDSCSTSKQATNEHVQ